MAETGGKRVFLENKQLNNPKKKFLSFFAPARLKKSILFLGRAAKKVERGFIFIKNIVEKFFPLIPRYAMHLAILIVALLVIFNNLSGRTDQNKGEEREGTSILFAGVLSSGNFRLVEGRANPADLPQGIGGFRSQVLNTVLASDDNTDSAEGIEEGPALATISGVALIPLAILEQEIEAGPLEEERKETIEHVVSAGESISTIAASYGVTAATVLSANDLSETTYIKPGDKLEIPPVSGVLYTVKPGDTLGVIAKTYKGDLDQIMEYNDLDSEDSIQIGQVLMIPGGKIPPLPAKTPSKYAVQYPNNQTSVGKAGWRWPAASRKINQYYSYRHHGVDIGAATGSPIYAARGGTVVFAGWRSGYGKTIIISHPNGTQTLYAHLSGYKRTSGSVASGELVGYVGSTGWSTGSHLHFEIRTSRGTVNPLNYIR